MYEKSPLLLTVYFHSLAVFDIVAGIGILMNKKCGYIITLLIALTQIPAHSYVLVLDVYRLYGSGVSVLVREIEIFLSVCFLMYVVYALVSRKPHTLRPQESSAA